MEDKRDFIVFDEEHVLRGMIEANLKIRMFMYGWVAGVVAAGVFFTIVSVVAAW